MIKSATIPVQLWTYKLPHTPQGWKLLAQYYEKPMVFPMADIHNVEYLELRVDRTLLEHQKIH